MLCIHNLRGRQGMLGYVHSEGILITQKKEFHVKAVLGFRVNYVYSRINYQIQARGSARKTGDLCLVSLTAKTVTSNMRYLVQLLSNYPDAYRRR
jgi:hypothetical protein